MIPRDVIRKAQKRFTDEGIKGVLVGTAALELHGYNIVAEDLDFLVERIPSLTPEEEKSCNECLDGDAASAGLRTKIDNVPVDYIEADKTRIRFLSEFPVVIDGIRVSTLWDAIELKRQAARPKDIFFLRGWDACVKAPMADIEYGERLHGFKD